MSKLSKVFALFLVVVMLVGTTAFAAGGVQSKAENKVMTITGINSSVTITIPGGETGEEKRAEVSYENASLSDQYLALMVKATVVEKEDGTKEKTYPINDKTIIYIDQAEAKDGVVTFENIYPSELADSIILITGANIDPSNLDGNEIANQLVACIVEAKYMLGDVNCNGVVNTGDAMLLLQYVAELADLTETGLLAADVNRVGGVNTGDAMRLLQFIAELIDDLEDGLS